MSHIDQMPEEKTPCACKIVMGLIVLIVIGIIAHLAGVPLPPW